MNPRYQRFGVDSAWRRFEIATRHDDTPFERALRKFEMNAARVNLDPTAVHLAAEVAALEPALDDDARLALVVLVLISLAALEEGSTRFPVTGPGAREPTSRILTALVGDGDGAEKFARDIAALVSNRRAATVIGTSADEFKPLLYLEPWLYHQRIHTAERALGANLAALLRSDAPAPRADAAIEAALADIDARPPAGDAGPLALTGEQRLAVAVAAKSRLAVISGGPGTGKTSIVVAILRVLARLGVDPAAVALAAPTGKAAYRMRAAVFEGLSRVPNRAPADDALLAANPGAATVHRLLGYMPDARRFLHHPNNPLAASVVIVDEGSMLDLVLMERLVGALKPDARLVILGDADQLPSVAAGAVLRDLVPPRGAGGAESAGVLGNRCVLLHENFRTRTAGPAGAAIGTVADAINAGTADLLTAAGAGAAPVARRASAAELSFEGVEFIAAPPARLEEFLERWHREVLFGGPGLRALLRTEFVEEENGFAGEDLARLRRVFEHVARARILSPTRLFTTGTERVNDLIHALTAAEARTAPARGRFLAGEPLMVLRNDYERGLFNGDQGAVLLVRRGHGAAQPMAVFARADNFVAWRIEAVADRVELSYAITVHKAQGSEFDTVAIILPERPLAMMTREILYTAITRSRKSVIIIGDPNRAAEAIGRGAPRYSGLAELLRTSRATARAQSA
jgi:exodeoxyribonuclease V alpha subunit